MDWNECDLAETVPGKVLGKPVVVGTGIPADLVLDLVDTGYTEEEILMGYPSLTAEVVDRIAAFAHAHQDRHA